MEHRLFQVENESICLRYVENDLVRLKVFMGLYQTSVTTEKVLANIVLDALMRLKPSLTCLRGQTYCIVLLTCLEDLMVMIRNL